MQPGMVPDKQNLLTDDLAQELAQVHAGYRAYIDSLPSAVRSLMIIVPTPDVFMSSGRLSVIALPFWVGKSINVDLEICRKIALANIFGLLHFIVQDNLTDGDWSEETMPGHVLSGTLYLQQMFARYQQFFPPQSTFWSLLNQYWLEWADSIVWERQANTDISFSAENMLKAARKAAPLKISTSGLALLGKQENLIPDLEQAVDLMHIVMQMADDLVDMAEDLNSNRYNSALSLMFSRGTLNLQAEIEINQVGRALFTSGDDVVYFRQMWEIAEKARNLLNRMGFHEWAELIYQTAYQAQVWRDQHVESLLSSVVKSSQKEGIEEYQPK
jgi:hypothetical protein